MNLREVTVGRSNNCDIYLDARCKYASNMHATIFSDGNQLMYKDTSTNGTMINNVNVHKRSIPINRGDIIMIAGKYPLSWNQIDSFFPNSSNKQMNIIASAFPQPQSARVQQQPNTSKWNWGAFFLPGIWGLFNGCWWLLLLSFLPIYPVVNIIAGIKGNEWAWNNKTWNSVQDFENTQDTWNKVGLVLFCVGLVGIISSFRYFITLFNL